MTEELGKITRLPVEDFKKGRKIFFVPAVYHGEDLAEEDVRRYDNYREQVVKQIAELSSKLGEVKKVYHELIAVSGEEGAGAIKELNKPSYGIIAACLEKKAQLEALDDADILTEYMDWSRCLMVGLQNVKVISKVYESYTAVAKKRNEYIARRIDETLKEGEIGVVLMRENHQVQFPADIQVFYISPPALDEIKRWLRERQAKPDGESAEK